MLLDVGGFAGASVATSDPWQVAAPAADPWAAETSVAAATPLDPWNNSSRSPPKHVATQPVICDPWMSSEQTVPGK